MAKIECGKTRKVDNPYEIWRSKDGTWEWRVLKKWQLNANDDEPHSRWFCMVTSPFCPDGEMGDAYVSEIKQQARRVDTPAVV